MPRKPDIEVEFDEQSGEYYAVWNLVAIGLGRTSSEALEDLREAVHLGVDTLIDLKLGDRGDRDLADGV